MRIFMYRLFVCCFVLFPFLSALGQSPTHKSAASKVVSPFEEQRLNQQAGFATKIDSLNNRIEAGRSKKDSSTISDLLALSYAYANNAQYSESYDGYWQTLILAEQEKNDAARALTYHGLGWLYSLYNRNEKAIEYFNRSLEINKRLVDDSIKNKTSLTQDYYALLTLYRKEGNVAKARQYLDSAKMFAYRPMVDPGQHSYFDAEDGYLYHLEKQPVRALEKLNQARPFFDGEVKQSYLGILFSFYGDVYQSLGAYDTSLYYYNKAIESIETARMHADLEPGIMENMATVYGKKGNYEAAYNMLAQAKTVTERQFGSRSANNRVLLEIKDDYRATKEKQQLEQLETEKKISNLKATVFAISSAFLLLLGFMVVRYLRHRYRVEKELMRKKQELEMGKAKEMLEFKNKELTTSTLRIIEKDELLSDLKERLDDQKKNPNPDEIKRLVKTIDTNTYNNWEEFEARFSSVNESFYDVLQERFPQLTHSDKKICALIKLNFSSKDMARLLGISIESVHTTRYRLRKKLHLEHETNLYDFIQQLK